MCGITGIFAFNLVGKFNRVHITAATQSLQKRGPDFQDIYTDDWVGLGHRRLSIIDTSDSGNQPMWDASRRYCIVFNGEIFNYRELRREFENLGTKFQSQSDTEVLLHLYIREKEKCLNRLNGFFAFCVYDKQEQTFFIARDRYGIKPLLYVFDEDKFIFASEMKSVLQYGIDKTIDYTSLHTYLQLNYIPAPHTIFGAVKKLMPGHYIRVRRGHHETYCYYTIPYDRQAAEANNLSYDAAKNKLRQLLEESVQRRLIADVPLGSFLSGGIDSSVITALAAKHKPDLHTFSIGFRDEPFFDETAYAKLVASHLKTEHTVFSLTNDDLFAHVHSILDYIDEPFADSSAINVYILSRETRKHATVALSGDGADELLGGYNKHAALHRMQHPGWQEHAVSTFSPLWKALPKSRNGKLSNKIRQLARFSESLRLPSADRYWKLAAYASGDQALALLSPHARQQFIQNEYRSRQEALLQAIPARENMNDILLTDTQLVLANDMLTKVDLMSMAQGLEVRVPFLDVNVVNFVFSLPAAFKIDNHLRKKILQDAYRDVLPQALYNRPKKGFEVPLLKWFRQEMRSLITDDLLSEQRIREQGVFDYDAIDLLKRQLFSSNPGDVHARLWGLIVFQWWWKKHIKS